MAKWIEYTGSNAQIEEIYNNECMLRLPSGNEVSKSKSVFVSDLPKILETISHYLICEPHPLADMICQQAQTGQPVWVKLKVTKEVYKTNTPNWHFYADYSFEPFKEEV